MVRALASHQNVAPGSNPGVDVKCGLSLLLVRSPPLGGRGVTWVNICWVCAAGL